MIIEIKKTEEQITTEKALRFPKGFYDLGLNLLSVFSQNQLDAIIIALEEKKSRHQGIAKMTENSGYGKASTKLKAQEHRDKAEYYQELLNAININSM